MEIGLFAKTFDRPTLEETFDAVVASGVRHVQFNMSSAGLPSMPDEIDAAISERIRRESESRDIVISAVSGTYNIIHPDPQVRLDALRRLRVVAESCRAVGSSVVTLCTGTCDPDYLWSAHPNNSLPESWADMVREMAKAVEIAEQADVTLAVEPEVSNVMDSAANARRLLDELASPRVKVVMDGANLFPAGSLPRMPEILREAFDLLGGDIVLAHAKDLSRDGEAGHEAAGTGLLDYDLYVSLLASCGYDGPLLLHSLRESQVPASVAFLRSKLAAA